MQQRIDALDDMLQATVDHPEWFADVVRARAWLEEEIMQFETDQLLEMANSRRPGRLSEKDCLNNLIVPIVPQWRRDGKGVKA